MAPIGYKGKRKSDAAGYCAFTFITRLRRPDGSGYILKVILVVDDESGVRALVRSILQHAGHQVSEAADAAQALEILRVRSPEILLTDIVMPGMSGLVLAARAHQLHPSMPVIFMSGFASQYSDELEGSVCLRKPFTANQLLLAVADAIHQEKTVRRMP
jgi:DNA-binding NtrC family response regulator